MTSAFSGIRIIDLSDKTVGSYTGLLLCDMGAEVIKVEAHENTLDPNDRFFNRGKKSISLDVTDQSKRDQLDQLIQTADVLISTRLIDNAKSLKLDYENIAKVNPSLIYCSIPPYGDSGPMANIPGDDGTIGTYTGIHEGQGGEVGSPIYVQVPFVDYGTAFTASLAISAALLERESSGQGQKVEVPMYAGSGAMQATSFITGDDITTPPRNSRPAKGLPIYRLYECSDSWLFMACGNNVFWNKLCIGLELYELIDDERFANAPWGIALENWDALSDILEPIFASNTREHWLKILRENDIPCGPAETREWYKSHPQVLYNQNLLEIEDPKLGKTVQPAPPIKMYKSPAKPQGAAPLFGEHNQILNELKPINKSAKNIKLSHPLDGIKVLDLTGYIAGAYGTTMLSDLGADVLKVESFAGDGFRQNSAAFQGWNQGKRGAIFNLKTPEGMKIFHQLLEEADVVTENYRGGIAKKLGVDYESLTKINPKIIYSTVNGYGLSGPYSNYPAFDPLIQAQSGLMRNQGGDGPPIFLRIAASDYSSAILSAYGIVAALYYREIHGVGQNLEVSLVNSSFAYQAAEYFSYTNKEEQKRFGTLGQSCDYRLYETNDGWIFLSCREDNDWEKLSDVLNLPNLFEFKDKNLRYKNEAKINQALEEKFKTNTVDSWINLLQKSKIMCAPNKIIRTLHDDPQAHAIGISTEVDSFNIGRIKLQGLPFQFSRTPGKLDLPAPAHGEHTDEVLNELGYSQVQIEDFRSRNVVG